MKICLDIHAQELDYLGTTLNLLFSESPKVVVTARSTSFNVTTLAPKAAAASPATPVPLVK